MTGQKKAKHFPIEEEEEEEEEEEDEKDEEEFQKI